MPLQRKKNRTRRETRMENNDEYIVNRDDPHLLAKRAGVLSALLLLPGGAGRDDGQRICAGRTAGPSTSPSAGNTHDDGRGDRDHEPVPLQRNAAPDWLCRCGRGASRGIDTRGVQAWISGQLAQRTYSTLCAGALSGRTAAGQTTHCLWLHLLRRVPTPGQGAFHTTVACQDESRHCP